MPKYKLGVDMKNVKIKWAKGDKQLSVLLETKMAITLC